MNIWNRPSVLVAPSSTVEEKAFRCREKSRVAKVFLSTFFASRKSRDEILSTGLGERRALTQPVIHGHFPPILQPLFLHLLLTILAQKKFEEVFIYAT